ncbi:hypothetical protein ACQ4N7_30005 [Nodosilinea sp. AN01ver1]|uniref:hypothetical protein n=1 Tax=Nodosilinea sp. AN01ver1 TaxID=3423362 RepID=UPI003D3176BA
MTKIPVEFQGVVTRFTAKLARIHPVVSLHLDDDASAIDRRYAIDRHDAADSALDDESAINRLFTKEN